MKLALNELNSMIDHYKLEIRKLQFQLEKFEEILSDLQHQKKSSPEKKAEEVVAEPALKSEKPAKVRVKETKQKSAKKIKLSEWEKFLLDTLKTHDKLIPSSLLLDLGRDRAKTLGIKLSEKQLRAKISNNLHKMVNVKQMIKKYDKPGKGHAYALPEWFTDKGELKSKYKEK